MSVFVISDLHLSSTADKSMEVFGARWQNYSSRLQNNWNRVVGNNDFVIVPGDISWGMTLEEALPDLLFLNSLKGRKIIGKGNHDFWWPTVSKINSFFSGHQIDSIDILHNNAHSLGDMIVAGTRGWYNEPSRQTSQGSPDYDKIVAREAARLKISLDAAWKLREGSPIDLPLVVFLHFPPVWSGFVCREIVDILHKYEVKTCYFGHIHGSYTAQRSFVFENVTFELISSDFIDFTPRPVIIRK